ncbi:MAG: carboxypeptidase regulatory-like domain-containing protein [Planctomycetes bacterium]|nr:carboxypeptidase regulatory-like domain-containing protein [Planctomycetota bacterium]
MVRSLRILGILCLLASALGLYLALAPSSPRPRSAELGDPAAESEPRIDELSAPLPSSREESVDALRVAAEAAPSAALPRDLIVRVLDARAQPVSDIPVELWTELAEPDAKGNWQLDLQTFTPRERTPRGDLAIPSTVLATAFGKAREARAAGHAASAILRAESELLACTSYEFRDLTEPENAVELRLAPSGFLRIEATLPDGTPATHPLQVLVASTAETSPFALPRHLRGRTRFQALEPQRSRLRVPLATPLRVEIEAHRDLGLLAHRAELLGPAEEGGEVLLRVPLRRATILVGRLLSADGAPLVRRELFVQCLRDGAGRTLPEEATDHEGRFRIVLDDDPPPSHLIELRIFPLPAEDAWQNPTELERRPHAVVRDLALAPSGTTELGDVVLTASEHHFLAAGTVVDASGAPVSHALVHACRGTVDQALSATLSFCTTEGRFELYSPEPLARLLVVARSSGYYLERAVEAEAGDRDVRIVLQRTGWIEGRILVPEGFPPNALHIRRSADGAVRATTTAADDGRFRFEQCTPGRHGLSFHMFPWPPVLVLDDLAVDRSERCTDPRLREIDLRSLVTALRIRALDTRAEPLPRKGLNLRLRAAEDVVLEISTDDAGRCTIPLPSHLSSVELALPGGPFLSVAVGPGEHDVQLEAPIELALVLDPAPALPPDVQLSASVIPLDADEALVRTGRLAYGTIYFREGEARWRVATPGRYALRWSVHAEHAKRSPIELAESAPRALAVQHGSSPQRFAVAPPAELLHAALTELSIK